MVKLKDIKILPADRLSVTIEVLHSDDQTTLSQDLELVIWGGQYVEKKVDATMIFTDLSAPTTRDVMKKMSSWLKRLASSLDESSDSNLFEIPV